MVTSSAVVGSSNSRIGGHCASAQAIDNRRFIPPDSFRTSVFSSSSSSKEESSNSRCSDCQTPHSFRLSFTVSSSISGGSCGTYPTYFRKHVRFCSGFFPKKEISPASGRMAPARICISVVLPQPFFPARARHCPHSASSEISSNTVRFPYFFLICETLSIHFPLSSINPAWKPSSAPGVFSEASYILPRSGQMSHPA